MEIKKSESCGCFVCGIVHPCTLHGVPFYPNCVGFHIFPTVMLEMSTYHFGAIKIGQLKATYAKFIKASIAFPSSIIFIPYMFEFFCEMVHLGCITFDVTLVETHLFQTSFQLFPILFPIVSNTCFNIGKKLNINYKIHFTNLVIIILINKSFHVMQGKLILFCKIGISFEVKKCTQMKF
jgi:hypothetical protein